MSAKFLQVGKRKDKNVLDCGLAANDVFLARCAWEVPGHFYFHSIAFVDLIFEGINVSVKPNHSWSKLQEIHKGLVKDYEVIWLKKW